MSAGAGSEQPRVPIQALMSARLEWKCSDSWQFPDETPGAIRYPNAAAKKRQKRAAKMPAPSECRDFVEKAKAASHMDQYPAEPRSGELEGPRWSAANRSPRHCLGLSDHRSSRCGPRPSRCSHRCRYVSCGLVTGPAPGQHNKSKADVKRKTHDSAGRRIEGALMPGSVYSRGTWIASVTRNRGAGDQP